MVTVVQTGPTTTLLILLPVKLGFILAIIPLLLKLDELWAW